MNWKHILYIIPLCLVLGYTIGLYMGIPKNVTIDIGDNFKESIELMDNLSIDYKNCPSPICNCNPIKYYNCSYNLNNLTEVLDHLHDICDTERLTMETFGNKTAWFYIDSGNMLKSLNGCRYNDIIEKKIIFND